MRPHDLAKKYPIFNLPYNFALRVINHRNYKKETKRYNNWAHFHIPSSQELKNQSNYNFNSKVKFSFVIPLYNTPKKFLKSLISSIQDQSYDNWEICFSDGGGKETTLRDILDEYVCNDNRIKVKFNDKQLKISDNTNEALSMVEGDYIVFGDHDDLFAPNALFECAKVIEDNPDVDLIYSDEDKVDASGKKFSQPAFKPDFNLDMLRSTNYICHLTCVKTSLQKKVGGLRNKFDGAQDYDFVLRCSEETKNIIHIPKILYHWRVHNNSTAKKQDSKSYAFDAGMEALKSYYKDLNINAEVLYTKLKDDVINGIYRTKYLIEEDPLVSIVIPNKDHIDDLDKCVKSLYEINTYKNFEIVIIENNSEDKSTFDYYDSLKQKHQNVYIYKFPKNVFNYSAINNFGVSKTKGDYVLLLNNDTEVIKPNSIYEMLSNCMREEIGAVGCKLMYPDDTIQHAGVILGMCGVASHCFINYPGIVPGYASRLFMAQNFNACTAACLMVEKRAFNKAGGFDEEFVVAYNDIDLCLQIRDAGYLITFTPYAEFRHYESKSRGYEDTPEKKERFNKEIDLFKKKWQSKLDKCDEYYNPNLSLNSTDFAVNYNMI